MQLTRERIITAAMELIEGEGADAVSMRRIATHLGSEVMSLYDHVPSKAAVLDGVADVVMAAVIDIPADTSAGWAEQVRAQVRAFRQVALLYPRCVMVVVSRPVDTAATLRPVERALATLRSAGFEGEEAIRAVRLFVAYVVGSAVREFGVSPGLVPKRPLGLDPTSLTADRPIHLDPAEFPQVVSLSAELLDRDFETDFEFGLDLLVRAVADRRPVKNLNRRDALQPAP
jgi:AcrR family transcriptional regulator